jgi:hypothetical protein
MRIGLGHVILVTIIHLRVELLEVAIAVFECTVVDSRPGRLLTEKPSAMVPRWRLLSLQRLAQKTDRQSKLLS